MSSQRIDDVGIPLPQGTIKHEEPNLSICTAIPVKSNDPSIDIDPETVSRTGSFSSVKEDVENTTQSFLVRHSSSRDLLSRLSQVEDWAKCLPIHGVLSSDAEIIPETIYEEPSCIAPDSDSLDHLSCSQVLEQKSINLEHFPIEILENIIDFLSLDVPPQDYSPRNVDVVSCLLTSKKLYNATLNILYKNITIPHSYVFFKFLTHLRRNPYLGRRVRRLDLSHFTSLGLNRSREMNKDIQNMTSKTLLECLNMMPNLQELLLQEHLDQDINESILYKIFTGLPRLRALDLCGAYTHGFDKAFTAAIDRAAQEDAKLKVTRLSLHECRTIKNADMRSLISRLPNLEILDLYHTEVTTSTLSAIPTTARLTHLNLGQCTNISGENLLEFLLYHPAAQELIYLNLSCDPARHRLFQSRHLDQLLPHLPRTLRSLNLGGAPLTSTHLPHLQRLSTHLEELGLAHTKLSMEDIKSFFPPQPTADPPADAQSASKQPTLHYLDLSSIPSVTQSSLFFHKSSSSRIDAENPAPIPHFLSQATLPLEVLEVSDSVMKPLATMVKSNKRFGWATRELGRRNWYVRLQGEGLPGGSHGGKNGGELLNGRSDWKMGVRSWGMRKIPVCVGEVGGYYGYCMFKK